jgi:hypothetical protein
VSLVAPSAASTVFSTSRWNGPDVVLLANGWFAMDSVHTEGDS